MIVRWNKSSPHRPVAAVAVAAVIYAAAGAADISVVVLVYAPVIVLPDRFPLGIGNKFQV